MAILHDASLQDKKRLLELFPIAVFRENHANLPGTKEEATSWLHEGDLPPQLCAQDHTRPAELEAEASLGAAPSAEDMETQRIKNVAVMWLA